MSHPDEDDWARESALDEFFESRLSEESRAPVFEYLATHGDEIGARVDHCRLEAIALQDAGFFGAAVVRAAAGLELAIRYYLLKPLLLGAFLSDRWTGLLADKLLNRRTAEDRDLLPAILRNYGIDITSSSLPNGLQTWETIVAKVWPARNLYVHQGALIGSDDAELAIASLDALLADIISPLALQLGFTLRETGKWSVVLPSGPQRAYNVPRIYERRSPFKKPE